MAKLYIPPQPVYRSGIFNMPNKINTKVFGVDDYDDAVRKSLSKDVNSQIAKINEEFAQQLVLEKEKSFVEGTREGFLSPPLAIFEGESIQPTLQAYKYSELKEHPPVKEKIAELREKELWKTELNKTLAQGGATVEELITGTYSEKTKKLLKKDEKLRDKYRQLRDEIAIEGKLNARNILSKEIMGNNTPVTISDEFTIINRAAIHDLQKKNEDVISFIRDIRGNPIPKESLNSENYNIRDFMVPPKFTLKEKEASSLRMTVDNKFAADASNMTVDDYINVPVEEDFYGEDKYGNWVKMNKEEYDEYLQKLNVSLHSAEEDLIPITDEFGEVQMVTIDEFAKILEEMNKPSRWAEEPSYPVEEMKIPTEEEAEAELKEAERQIAEEQALGIAQLNEKKMLKEILKAKFEPIFAPMIMRENETRLETELQKAIDKTRLLKEEEQKINTILQQSKDVEKAKLETSQEVESKYNLELQELEDLKILENKANDKLKEKTREMIQQEVNHQKELNKMYSIAKDKISLDRQQAIKEISSNDSIPLENRKVLMDEIIINARSKILGIEKLQKSQVDQLITRLRDNEKKANEHVKNLLEKQKELRGEEIIKYRLDQEEQQKQIEKNAKRKLNIAKNNERLAEVNFIKNTVQDEDSKVKINEIKRELTNTKNSLKSNPELPPEVIKKQSDEYNEVAIKKINQTADDVINRKEQIVEGLKQQEMELEDDIENWKEYERGVKQQIINQVPVPSYLTKQQTDDLYFLSREFDRAYSENNEKIRRAANDAEIKKIKADANVGMKKILSKINKILDNASEKFKQFVDETNDQKIIQLENKKLSEILPTADQELNSWTEAYLTGLYHSTIENKKSPFENNSKFRKKYIQLAGVEKYEEFKRLNTK